MSQLPYLLVKRSQAEALLRNQIRRGEAAINHELNDESIDAAIERFDAWEVQSRDLLLSMFDSSTFADEFMNAGTYPKNKQTLQQKLTYLSRLTYKVYYLNDIIKDLPLFPEKVEEPQIPPRSSKAPSLPQLLTESKATADGLIADQIKEGRLIQKITDPTKQAQEFDRWNGSTLQLVVDLTDSDKWARTYLLTSESTDAPATQIDDKIDWLKTLQRLIKYHYPESPATKSSTLDTLNLVCSHFHSVVRQLRTRQRNRTPFTVQDEYDVQDLLRSLLAIYFQDVRNEDPSPKQAAASSRIDFVLKTEHAQIECKMTRDDLRDRQLSDELILDIERYRSHPDRELLYCFVYDPGEFISNPTAIENDLSRTEGERTVRVSIYPKR